VTRILLIAAGGAIGAVARYVVSAAIGHTFAGTFPLGTFVVNISGSFAIGVAYEFSSVVALPPLFRELAAIGFLGAYTTFSTLAVETNMLLRDRELGLAALYVGATVLSGVVVCLAGMMLGRILARLL
jgi:CrcB protein